jgi:hypothetical protein
MNNQTTQQAPKTQSHEETMNGLQNIIHAINLHPTYNPEEEAYIISLHDLISEARAKQKQAMRTQ